ncbi:MAG: hypothetical protein ACR2FU_09780 [Streptosporangiaceae bacterium]
MSGSSSSSTASGDSAQRWADLDKQNERLVDATHPLLADLRRDYPGSAQPAAALA